jgi:hypothetical protein
VAKSVLGGRLAANGVGWGLSIAGEPTVHHPGEPIGGARTRRRRRLQRLRADFGASLITRLTGRCPTDTTASRQPRTTERTSQKR